jgi:hypothetical protein
MAMLGKVAIVLFVTAISITRISLEDQSGIPQSVNLRYDEGIIPVPSAPQLRYQSTDFVGKQHTRHSMYSFWRCVDSISQFRILTALILLYTPSTLRLLSHVAAVPCCDTTPTALIHFNMATYARDGDPGCDATNWNQRAPNATGPTSDPHTFFPKSLNTTQWFDSISALGAKIAVLTAKHGCGFLLWPTNATLPPHENDRAFASTDSGRIARAATESSPPPIPYGYHTSYDLLQDFVDSAKASGVGYGFYYSIMKNFFLCRSFTGQNSCTETILSGQHNATDDEYHSIVKHQLTELWTNYGDLAEVWIDSKLEGFGAMLDELQPRAGGTPSNPRQWCGTESGFPSRDVGQGSIWQTGEGFFGDPSAPNWVDKFCDPQLFRDHIWFYEPQRKVKTLEEMIPMYHDIVGRGMVMELAFAINREGLVEASHEAVYQQLGEWVEGCYGTPLLSKQNSIGENIIQLKLPPSMSAGYSFDRIVLQEDVAVGQRIRNYTIDLVDDDDDGKILVRLVPDGNSVGRKRIHLLSNTAASPPPPPLALSMSVVLTITAAIGPPHVSLFGVYAPCYPESSER